MAPTTITVVQMPSTLIRPPFFPLLLTQVTRYARPPDRMQVEADDSTVAADRVTKEERAPPLPLPQPPTVPSNCSCYAELERN